METMNDIFTIITFVFLILCVMLFIYLSRYKKSELTQDEKIELNKDLSLYDIFMSAYGRFKETYNPSDCYIDGGRTINRQFDNMCTIIYYNMKAPKNTWYELFREGMMNTASNYNAKPLEEALWNNIEQFIETGH
jgi:hypothetical protein